MWLLGISKCTLLARQRTESKTKIQTNSENKRTQKTKQPKRPENFIVLYAVPSGAVLPLKVQIVQALF